MELLKLCESDYRFMCVVWEHEPLTSRNLVERCDELLGWKKSTTYTTLKKLCTKGFAQNEDTVVSSRIPKEQVQAFASKHFVEHTFGGSLPQFLTSFFDGKAISGQEAMELKKLIDQHRR